MKSFVFFYNPWIWKDIEKEKKVRQAQHFWFIVSVVF